MTAMTPRCAHPTHPTQPGHEADPLERHIVTIAPARPARVRSIDSQQLFADFAELQITHGDAVYRLRRTSLGKLILTK